MLNPIRRLIPGGALPILALSALSALSACTQPDGKDEAKNTGNQDMKTLSSQLGQPYLINDKGEIISEIPPFVLEKMKADLRQQARMAEAFELENMYDAETGKLREIGKLDEIQNRLDRLAAGKQLPAAKGGDQ